MPLIIKRCKADYQSAVSLKLKKGCLILIPTTAIHYDGDIYVDPHNFDPDRFLEDDIEKMSTFMPFGSKLTCENNGKGEIFLYLNAYFVTEKERIL